MKKMPLIIMCLCSLGAFAQEQEREIDVFLNENMLKGMDLNVEFNHSIAYVAGDLLLLSSPNQFYALSLDGIFPVLERTTAKIDAFSIATVDSIVLVISDKTLYQIDTEGKLVKVKDLPTARMGIASDKDGTYLFEQASIKNKREYSLFSLSSMAVLTKVISTPAPINSACKYQSTLFFTSQNKIYSVVEGGGKHEEFFTLPGSENKIISLAGDVARQTLYFSTADTIYRVRDNELEYVCTDFGGIVKYDDEGLLIFNPEKHLIVRLRENLLYPPVITRPAIPAVDPAKFLPDEKLRQLSLPGVRQLVLQNRIGEAIGGYAYLLAKKPTNTALLAEYAYALALGGAYDCALMNLDRVWLISPRSDEGQFYAALVFSLMGYDDIQEGLIKNIPEGKKPRWISREAHLELAKTRAQAPLLTWGDPNVFRRVNYLAANGLYLQSIAMYEEIINADRQEFLPHIGYSMVLEKAGFYRKALQELEKGVALMPDSLSEAKTAFEKRETVLANKINAPKTLRSKIFKLNDNFGPQTMLYAGGMVTKSSVSFDSRFGLYLNNTFNGAIDLGLSGGKDVFNVNLGASAYQRFFGFLVWGEGLNLQAGKSTVLSLKSTVGFSFITRNGRSSLDIFFDYYQPFKKETKGTFGISIGRSIYFGTRKARGI